MKRPNRAPSVTSLSAIFKLAIITKLGQPMNKNGFIDTKKIAQLSRTVTGTTNMECTSRSEGVANEPLPHYYKETFKVRSLTARE